MASRTPSIVASHAASPIVKAGKMMWKLMTNANWMRDRMTGSSSMPVPPIVIVRRLAHQAHAASDLVPSAAAARREAPRHDDLGGHDLRWPGEVRKAGRHGNLLRTVRGIGDHAAADRAAEILAPKFLAGGGIERIEVAAHVAEEHDAAGRRSHAADDRVVRLQAPLPDAGVGVDGVDPPSPVSVRATFCRTSRTDSMSPCRPMAARSSPTAVH